MSDFIVCSFHTDDEYYRRHGEELKKSLSDLGVTYVVEEIAKKPGQDWADLCRQKVPFLKRICDENPDSKVFWIDVDCRLLSLPDFVRDSTRRHHRLPARLLEPAHHRLPQARPLLGAVLLGRQHHARGAPHDHRRRRSSRRGPTIKATDDYFFEEGWRANAAELTFQIIPSTCVVGKGGPLTDRHGLLPLRLQRQRRRVQGQGRAAHRRRPGRPTRQALNARGPPSSRPARRPSTRMPPSARRRLIALADKSGATGLLLPGSSATPRSAMPAAKKLPCHRQEPQGAGQLGPARRHRRRPAESLEQAARPLPASGVLTREEEGTLCARPAASPTTRPARRRRSSTWSGGSGRSRATTATGSAR